MNLFKRKPKDEIAETTPATKGAEESASKKALTTKQIALYSTAGVVVIGGLSFLGYNYYANQVVEIPVVVQEQPKPQEPKFSNEEKAKIYTALYEAGMSADVEALKYHPFTAEDINWDTWNQEMVKTKELAQKLRENYMKDVYQKQGITADEGKMILAEGANDKNWNPSKDPKHASGDFYISSAMKAFITGGEENLLKSYQHLEVAKALGNDHAMILIEKIGPAISQEDKETTVAVVTETLDSMNAEPVEVAVETEKEEEEEKEEPKKTTTKKWTGSNTTYKPVVTSEPTAKEDPYTASLVDADAMGGPSDIFVKRPPEPSWISAGQTKEEKAFKIGYEEGYLEGYVEGSVGGYDLGYDDGYEGRDKRTEAEIAVDTLPDDAPELPRGHYREVMRDMSQYSRREIWERNKQNVAQ